MTTSPLQQAHDAQLADGQAEEAREPVVCTVAGPRRPFSQETYMGAELRHTSARPGAYDALRMPSLFNGRPRPAGAMVPPSLSSVWTPPPSTPPVNRVLESRPRVLDVMAKEAEERAPKRHVGTPRGDRQLTQLRQLKPLARTKIRADYTPVAGSVVDRTIKHLQEHGGHLLHTEVVKRFGIKQNGLTSVFKASLLSGVLVRVLVDGRVGLSLPGYVPPPGVPKEPRGPKPTTALDRAKARLARTLAEIEQLEAAGKE